MRSYGRGARILCGLACAIAAAPAVASAAPALPLTHAGRWLVDAGGRTVLLHGFNAVAKGAPHLPSQLGFDEDDAAFLASQGFNTVRLGFDYGAIEPLPGVYDQAFLAALERDASVLASHGVFPLADVHQDIYTQRYGGNGLPDWAAVDNGLPNTPFPYPGNYPLDPAVQRAFDNFWANAAASDGKPLQAHYDEGLRRLAGALEPVDGLLGYDVFSEPWAGSQYPTCASPTGCPPGVGFDATSLTAFTRAAVAAARSADARHLIFYEPNLLYDFGADTTVGDSGDANAGFSFHDYCLGAAPGLPVFPDLIGACKALGEQLQIQNAEAHSAKTGDALLMTEFGATDDPAIAGRVADAADQRGIGWQFWGYINEYDGNQIPSQNILLDMHKPPTADNLNQKLLDALVRAYPQVTAGTPQSFGFDTAARRFNLRYSTKGPGGRDFAATRGLTEIFVPDRFYGGRYRVAVNGAEVAGGLGTQQLTIRNCAGTAIVDLTITGAAPEQTPSCAEQASLAQLGSVGVSVSGSACGKRRSLRIDIRRRAGRRPRSATVLINGRRVRRIGARGLRRPIVVRSLPDARLRVRVVVRTAAGRRVTIRRSYPACRRRGSRRRSRAQRRPRRSRTQPSPT